MISTILQNVESSASGVTVFDGEIQCDNLTASGDVTGNSVVCANLTTSAGIDTTSITASGSVSGLVGSFTTLDSVTTGGNVSQTAGTASLQATTVTSLTDTGNLTMSGTSAALSQTGTSATASLKATTVTSLTASGNITQSGGTTTLKKTTINGDSTAYLMAAYNASMTSGTAVWTELGADSSNGLITQFLKGSSTTENTAKLALSTAASTGALNIEYDNVNAPNFETNKLTVHTSVTLPTTLTTPTAGQLGYVLSKSGNSTVTLSTTIQEVVSSTNYLTVGVWLIQYQLRLVLAANTVANEVLVVLYGGTEAGNSGQISYNYSQISATTTGCNQTVSGCRIITVSTAHTSPLSVWAALKTSVTTITTVSNSDSRLSTIYAVRIA